MAQTACFYLRFSDDSQIGNTSFEVQEDHCRETCRREGWDIYPEMIKDDAVSADSQKSSKTHRVLDVLNYCKAHKGEFQILLVYNTNRFARDTEEHLWLRRELRQIGIVLKSSTERLGETAVDKFTETVFAAKNELDNEERRMKSHDGLWKRVEQGLWPWAPPFGYKVVLSYDDVLKPHIQDENCAKAVLDIFKKYATGTVTKVQLSREYKDRQIRNHKGVLIKFSPQLIDKILRKKYYAGVLDHKTKGEIKGLHVPIISRELFDKCQSEVIAKSNNRAKYRYSLNPELPLRKFTRCGFCNHSLTGAVQKKHTYPFYWCYNKKCTNCYKTIERKDLHNAFTTFLTKVKPTQRQVDKFNKTIMAKYSKLSTEIQEIYKLGMKKVEQAESDKEWTMAQSKKKLLTDEEFRVELEKNRLAISRAKSELANIYQEEVNIEEMLSKAKLFIETLELAWLEAPIAGKDRIQKFIFPEGVIFKNGVIETPKLNRLFKIIDTISTTSVSENQQLCPNVTVLETIREAIQGLKDLVNFMDTIPNYTVSV